MVTGGVAATGAMTAVTSGAPETFSTFVERDGTELVLGSDPYYFNGANAPWLTHTWPSRATVDDVLSFAAQVDVDVLRMGIHSVDVGGTVHSPKPGELGEEAFQHVDYIIREAEAHGIRLVFSLVDNWDYYGGMDAYVSNSPTASEHDDFYTDAQCREWYRTYVEKVLTRENTLTGRVYRDDPTILMWELANEAEAKSAGVDVLQSWKEEMAAHVKSVDSNHLLSTGSGGNYNTDSSIWEYSGGHGVDYVQNHRIPEIDVCSFHLYPEWLHENTNAYGKQWIRDHLEDARDVIEKPVFLGEFGWAKGRSPSRPAVYEDWYALLDKYDAAGAAPWQLVKADRSETSKHDIRPSDSGTTDVLVSFGETQTAKRSASGGDGGSGGSTASSLAGETLAVEGGGSDIWNQSDAFHFVHEQVTGDATSIVDVTAQEDTDGWAKAGVMLRGSTAVDAPHASMFVTPSNGVAFQHRSEAGGWTSHAGGNGGVPERLKLERRGDTITGYVDRGGSWEAVGSATIPMVEPHLGVAVTSHRSGALSTVRVDVVAARADERSSSWTNEDVGDVTTAGSARVVDDDDSGTAPSVSVSGATTSETAATLTGEVTDLGSASSASVFFEYGRPGSDLPNATAATTLDASGSFSTTVDGLEGATTYEFHAVAETADGRDASGTASFTTEGSAPVVDDFVFADTASASSSRYWVAWAVEDADADLDAVTVELRDGTGARVDGKTWNVQGANGGGQESFQATTDVAELRLTVTDAQGNETVAVRTPEV